MAKHALERIARDIDHTHDALGNMVAFNLAAVKARKCVLNIAPAGCGKSETNLIMRERIPNTLFFDSVTRAGLKELATVLTGFDGVSIVDDLGKVGNTYLRLETITTFCELTYSHFVSKYTATASFEIAGYNGAAIVGCQPVVLRRVMLSNEWDATIQDKTVRYYHLFRPLSPEPKLPQFTFSWGPALEEVEQPLLTGKQAQGVLAIGALQWSRSRTREHVGDLLRACAALDGRTAVNASDYRVLYNLMQPMKIEQLVMQRTGFEEGKEFDHNLLCIVVEFASYGSFTVADLVRDYRVSAPTAIGLMQRASRWWRSEKNSDETYFPTDRLQRLLEQMGGRKRGSK